MLTLVCVQAAGMGADPQDFHKMNSGSINEKTKFAQFEDTAQHSKAAMMF